MTVTVTTQTELDAATKAGETDIIINSPAGVWLTLCTPRASHVVAWGASHVEAWGASHVVAWDSTHVVARDSSHVVARESSHVVARDSSHVVARDASHVVARDASHVVAWESSHVVAWGASHVEATAYVAVHLHSARATVEGGHIIDVSALDLKDAVTWGAYTGATMLLDDDGRGYRLGTRNGRYFAGCRDFTAEEAVAHWSNPNHPAPESAALLLAAVQAHIASLEETA